MANPSGTDLNILVDGQYDVDVTQPLPGMGGGLPAFPATDMRGTPVTLMALSAGRHAPARPRALQTLTTGIKGLLTPVGYGPGPPVEGRGSWFVICHAPAGPPLSATPRPWPESALIERVLRPIAHALDELHTRGLTHRSIRPNNVFLTAGNLPVTLGAAWAAPPAMHQPVVFEPP